MESADTLMSSGSMVLVKTTDHILYKINEGEYIGKIMPNHYEKPKHILETAMAQLDHPVYRYSVWNIEDQVI